MRIQDRFDAIKSCEKMARAGKAAAMDCYQRLRRGDSDIVRADCGFTISDIWDCSQDLEKTYLIRVFAEFEVTLRDLWRNCARRRTKPPVETLVNKIASHYYVRTDVLNRAHAVREYRNSLIHGGLAIPVTLGAARKYLCEFLGHLPRQW
jgi:hypothetical protein